MAAPAAPSVFSSLFGGGTTPTTDTQAATAEIAGLNSNFTGMTSSLTSSISVATALSPELKGTVDTTSLTSALDSTKNLQETCKGLSSDECAKKQAQLQAETDAAQLKFFNDTLAAQIALLTKERDKIQTQYNAIKDEKTTALKGGALVFKADSVFPTYDDLLLRINADIEILQNSAPYTVPSTEGSQNSGSAGSAATLPPYELPSVTTATDYDIEHQQILTSYNSLVGNPYDLNRVMRNVKTFIYRKLVPIAFYITLIFSILWGGIVCSNMYLEAEQDFLAGRIWYFIHGMIGFPAVLAYSLIKPPFWVSGIFPLYARVLGSPVTEETTETNSTETNSANTNSTETNSANTNSTETNSANTNSANTSGEYE